MPLPRGEVVPFDIVVANSAHGRIEKSRSVDQ
jgi:hypothetical protein